MDLSLIFVEFLAKYPILGSIVGVIGIFRLVMKPLFSFFKEFVLATPSDKDDLFLSKVESSKAYAFVVFLVDYISSIKLPKK